MNWKNRVKKGGIHRIRRSIQLKLEHSDVATLGLTEETSKSSGFTEEGTIMPASAVSYIIISALHRF